MESDASIAGIARDHLGVWVLGFLQKCCTQTTLMGSHFLAALQIIEDRGWTRVIVNLDSQQAITRIVQKDTIKDANFIIVKQCRDLFMRMHEIRLEFKARNTNKDAAYRLAKMCRTDIIATYKSIIYVLLNKPPILFRMF